MSFSTIATQVKALSVHQNTSPRHKRRKQIIKFRRTRAVHGDDGDFEEKKNFIRMEGTTNDEKDSYEYGIFGKSIATYDSAETSYNDSAWDKFAIALFNAKLAGKIMESTEGTLSSDAKKFSMFSYERLVFLANEVLSLIHI